MRTHYIMKHKLKIEPEYFQAVKDGRKKFELRVNDRDFEENDILILQEYCPNKKEYTGSELFVKVTYILHEYDSGIGDYYCIMSIEFA